MPSLRYCPCGNSPEPLPKYRSKCDPCMAVTVKRSYDKFKAYKDQRKEEAGCYVCGPEVKWPTCALDWHHMDPATKAFDVSVLPWGRKRFDEEVAKCVCLCANHHRMFEAGVDLD